MGRAQNLEPWGSLERKKRSTRQALLGNGQWRRPSTGHSEENHTWIQPANSKRKGCPSDRYPSATLQLRGRRLLSIDAYIALKRVQVSQEAVVNENEPTELKFLLPQGRARLPGGTPVTGRRSGVANFALSAFLEPLVSMVGRTAELTITVDFSRHARSFAAKRGRLGAVIGHTVTTCSNKAAELLPRQAATALPPGERVWPQGSTPRVGTRAPMNSIVGSPCPLVSVSHSRECTAKS